jgi:TldD protein
MFLPLLARTVETVRRRPGVDYVDARAVVLEVEVVSLRGQGTSLREPSVDRLSRDRSEGVGVRVLYQGAWGFAARPGIDEQALAAAADDALLVAQASARIRKTPVRLVEEEASIGGWETPIEIDPFTVPLDQKLAELRAALAILAGDGDPRISSVEGRQLWRREHKWFASSEGSQTEQKIVHGGAGIKITASADGESAVRSWPLDLDGGVAGMGYEFVARLALPEHAARIREEALALLTAPVCPAGRTTLVLDTPQLALQIHESCGHPTELDRALGEEISLAGGSFLTPDKLGRFRYGSPRVNLVADARAPGGVGTFGWDDEGVAARRTPLVSRGVFVGYLSSREHAAVQSLGRSGGCVRAESWSRPAIIRMTNVSLDPDPKGPKSLDELIADTDDGMLMTTNRSWSIDDLRLNFQFGCEAAWKIEHGKLTTLYKRPLYTGSTPAFWGGCDAICSEDAWRMWGFLSCGKGDPIQLMGVGHGSAPARFRDVEVGAS